MFQCDYGEENNPIWQKSLYFMLQLLHFLYLFVRTSVYVSGSEFFLAKTFGNEAAEMKHEFDFL